MRAEVAAVGRPAFNSTPTESGVTAAYTQFANANGLETRVASPVGAVGMVWTPTPFGRGHLAPPMVQIRTFDVDMNY
jgi:hypothetical protein